MEKEVVVEIAIDSTNLTVCCFVTLLFPIALNVDDTLLTQFEKKINHAPLNFDCHINVQFLRFLKKRYLKSLGSPKIGEEQTLEYIIKSV